MTFISTSDNFTTRNNRRFNLFLLTLALICTMVNSASGQIIPNAMCSAAIPFCTTDLVTFSAGVNTGSPEPGPCYSCWGTQQNPAWFYMQIENPGSILIHMASNPAEDIDFICWGPFTSPTGACNGGLTCDMVVSCSYSPNPWEDCSIPKGMTGEFYILCIANFSNNPCEITFSQTGGTGTLNCNIVFNCSMLSLSPVASACNALTNTFDVMGTMEFSNPPATGTLTVTDNSGASQTFSSPFTTPQPYTLTGITCDGLGHTVTATFSDSPACTLSADYNSPNPVCPSALISGGGAICNDGIQNANVLISFLLGVPPYTFVYAIDGVSQPPVTHPAATDYQLQTKIPGLYTLVSVTNPVCPSVGGTVSGNAVVTLLPLPAASVSGTTAVCVGAADQVITFTGSSGTPPYTFSYHLNTGPTQTITTTSGNSATVSQPTAAPGDYSYTLESVTDANICSQPQAGNATITVYPLPTATISGNTAVCAGATPPVITFTGSTGSSPYTFFYHINTGPTQSVTTTSGNSVTVSQPTTNPGTYIYTLESVADAHNCSQTQPGNVTITVSPLPTASISGATGVCTGGPAQQVTFTGATGTAPYTFFYHVNTGPTLSVTTTSGNFVTVSQSAVTPGTYTYTLESVTDANSCSQIQSGSATITVFTIPTATISGTTALCSGSPAPNITFTGATGTAPYTFHYNVNWGATQSVTTVTGNSVTVPQPTATPGPFVYTLESVTDVNSCSQAQTGNATITVYPLPTAAIAGTTAVCSGVTPPVITFTGSAGSSPYTFFYHVNTGPTQSVTTTSGNSVTVSQPTTTPGTYIYTLESVTDLHACSQVQSGSANVTVNPLPTATISGPTQVCLNASSPNIVFTGASATPPYLFTYNINGGPVQSVISVGNIALVPVPTNSLGSKTYTLLGVQDGSATTCYQAQAGSHTITVNPLPVVSITPCFDVVTNRSAKRFLLKGGKPLLTATPLQGEYLVSPATAALTSDASGNYYFDPGMVPGTNAVTFSISYKYTSSQFGCTATSPSSVTVTVNAANPPCGTTMTDYRDNPPTTYLTAFLGGKCWMTENLRYGTLLSPIAASQADNCVTEKYCLTSDANCTAYGGLYQWDELIQYGVTAGPQYQGVCPAGWHIPAAADFQALIDANQGNGLAGSILKDMFLNPRGFEALLSGMAYMNISWSFTATDVPSGTLFWTSSPGSGNRIITRGVNSEVPSISYYESIKANAFPVRCVKD
jgi:uncharacterized protein (TIGR02145 family)